MSFDRDLFQSYLHNPEWAQNLMWFEETTSTNAVLADKQVPVGTVAIAAQQTAGRGQWGRTWVSQLGGLYLSVAIAPNLAADDAARLTLASAWGIATQLRQHQVATQLKWPNDLYIENKKLGGILTETSVQQGRIHRAVVGVGINWSNPTIESGIALQDLSTPIEPAIQGLEHLAALVVNGIDLGKQELLHRGLGLIIPDYRQWLYEPLPPGITWESL